MEKVTALLRQVREAGEVSYPHGDDVILVDPIPETKPQGWCYEMYAPLSEDDIAQLADGYRRHFPESLKEFYRLTNGMDLFDRQWRIFGMPVWAADYKQPMSLTFADGHRTTHCPKNRLFFALYQYGDDRQIQLFFNTDDPDVDMPVYAAWYGDNEIIACWSSFENWFIDEHARMLQLYRDGDFTYSEIAGGKFQLRSIQFDTRPPQQKL